MNTRAQTSAIGLPKRAVASNVPRKDSSSEDVSSKGTSLDADRAGDSLLCLMLCAYLVSLLLEGPLRYALAMTGIPNALYLRDAIPVSTLVVLFLRSMLADNRIDLAIAVPAAVLVFHAAYSAMAGVAFFSIAFGLKIFMFIPFGMAMWPLVRRRFDLALTVAAVMFAVTLVGVFINFWLDEMPWEGLAYETAFGAASTTRTWWLPGGTPRLPGFARTSFNAAMFLGITGVLTLVKFPSLPVRLVIFVLGTAAIVLTTTKGMLVGFPLAAIWVIVQQRRPWMTGYILVAIACVATMALPFLMVSFDLGSALPVSSFPTLLVSVWDRFTTMWPLAFDLLPEGPQALLGAGLGSIGTPQEYGYSPHRLNAADNFAIFMLVNFGVLGLCYYAMPAMSLRKVVQAEPVNIRRAFVALLLIAYGYGMSINMLEESFFSVVFGLCCGAAASAWLRPDRR